MIDTRDLQKAVDGYETALIERDRAKIETYRVMRNKLGESLCLSMDVEMNKVEKVGFLLKKPNQQVSSNFYYRVLIEIAAQYNQQQTSN